MCLHSVGTVQPISIGWVGLYAARQSADAKIVSEVIAAHIQGGFTVHGNIEIEAYVTGKRDKLQEIALMLETGYFVRPGAWTWNDVTFSGGAGNYTARRDDDEGIGREASDPTTTFGWVAFLTGRLKTSYGEASATARYKPSLDFKDTRVEILGALNKEISDAWAFGISTLVEIETEIHSSYLVNFNIYTRKIGFVELKEEEGGVAQLADSNVPMKHLSGWA